MFGGMFNFLKRKRHVPTARYVPTIVVEKDDSEKDSPMCSSRISSTTGAVVLTELYSSSPALNNASSSSSSPMAMTTPTKPLSPPQLVIKTKALAMPLASPLASPLQAVTPSFKDISTSQSESDTITQYDHLTPFERITRQCVDDVQMLVNHRGIRVSRPIRMKQDIYLGTLNGRSVAIKKQKFRRTNSEFKYWSTREANIQRMASEGPIFDRDRGHRHIVSFVDHLKIDTHGVHLLITEYCEFGTLLSLVKRAPDIGITRQQLLQFAIDLAIGVEFLHRLNIAHRDLKLENSLLSADRSHGRVVLKIADFGYSTLVTIHTLDQAQVGAPDYAAPESFNSRTLIGPLETDYWCFGVCLYGMFEGRFPFSRIPGPEHMGERLANFDLLRLGAFQISYERMRTSATFKALVEALLKYEPQDRCTMADVLRAPFFGSMVPKAITAPEMAGYLAMMGDSDSE